MSFMKDLARFLKKENAYLRVRGTKLEVYVDDKVIYEGHYILPDKILKDFDHERSYKS